MISSLKLCVRGEVGTANCRLAFARGETSPVTLADYKNTAINIKLHLSI